MQNRRSSKLAEMLRQEISRLLRFEIEKPELATAWISQVEVTGDLKKASVWFRLREGNPKIAEKEFPKVIGFFRRSIARELDLRYVPEIEFLFDAAGESRDRVMGLLEGMSATPASHTAQIEGLSYEA